MPSRLPNDHAKVRSDERRIHPAWGKRLLDLSCIAFALPVLLPLGLLIAAVIKCVSQGPVLFRQTRVGYRGRSFTCLKFRTMTSDADHAAHKRYYRHLITSAAPMTKMDLQGDHRLIRMGRMLRASGLDELPQVINVLRGEMSLVGPRPCLPYEYEGYAGWRRQRFDTLPGLTGYWQVNGKNSTTFDEMVRMDIWYAEHQSVRLDLHIMARTLPVLVAQVTDHGAAQEDEAPQRVEEVTRKTNTI